MTAAVEAWTDRRPLALLGAGSALPGPAIETAALIEAVEDRFGLKLPLARRIAEKLGVRARHIARDFRERRERPRPGAGNADLAAEAVRRALDDAGLQANDLDFLIGHTATPGRLLPSNVSAVAERLGYRGPFLELRQACTGFASALAVVQGLLGREGAGAVAVVGSETGSLYLDPVRAAEDHGQLVNLVQMGDGAAAAIFGPAGSNNVRGRIDAVFTGQIGAGRPPGLAQGDGGSDHPFTDGFVAEFAHDFAAVRESGPRLFEAGAAAAAGLGWSCDGVDWIVPHQANGRMDELLAPLLGATRRKIFVNADRLGNTGSAAIWLAFDELRRGARPGSRIAVLGAEATKHMFGGFGYVQG